jgi:uncharacterized protein (DUF1015 family)
MAVVAPFNGLTYNLEIGKDFSKLVAPPYDVISNEEQEAYYRSDAHNVIRLILGKKKVGDSDWDNRYTRAADTFKRWESEGTLIRSEQPCIYVTSHTYDPGEGEARRTRWGIVALVRIEDEGSGVILPHERTFSAHKDDRLRLMRACNAQFSQIFSLYEDPDDEVLEACRGEMRASPQVAFDLEDGTSHQMWALQSPALFKRLAEAMAEKSILIADGHHRYETARNFRNRMRARHGRRPENRSYEFAMMYLSNMSHEGLTILPSHRLVRRVPDFRLDDFLRRVGEWFDYETSPFPGPDIHQGCAALRHRLEKAGQQNSVIAFFPRHGDQGYLFSLRPGARDALGDDLHPSLKQLDVLVLSRFILQKGLGFKKEDLDDEEIFHYQSNMALALQDVSSGESEMAFLLNPTKMAQVREVASNGLVMPRKSTYFFPKVLSGLVFNKIDPHEIIQTP